MEMSMEDFAKSAIEKFGDKVSYTEIFVRQDDFDLINKLDEVNLTRQDFINYGKHVWLIGVVCPGCGARLDGLFGSFSWGIVHGEGYCSECNNVIFRYYHYIGNCKRPITGWELIGF